MLKRILIAMMAALAIAGAWAQTGAILQIQCNQSSAQVFVNGRLAGTTSPNLQTRLAPGTYQLMVAKSGFEPFQTTITLPASGLVLPVNLVLKGAAAPAPAPAPTTFPLTVTASQPTAFVFIDGQEIGRAPVTVQVTPGQHTVVVKSPAFLDFSQTVNVTGPLTVTAGVMQPQTQQLTVTANVPGAQILINGNPAGQVPFTAQLVPGSYTLTIRAPGFIDYTESFVMAAPKAVSVALLPSMASWQVVLPAVNVNADMKGGHWSQIQVYIDGVIQKDPMGQVAPGRKLVKITAGGLKVETFIDFVAGRSYVIEPSMALTVK